MNLSSVAMQWEEQCIEVYADFSIRSSEDLRSLETSLYRELQALEMLQFRYETVVR